MIGSAAHNGLVYGNSPGKWSESSLVESYSNINIGLQRWGAKLALYHHPKNLGKQQGQQGYPKVSQIVSCARNTVVISVLALSQPIYRAEDVFVGRSERLDGQLPAIQIKANSGIEECWVRTLRRTLV